MKRIELVCPAKMSASARAGQITTILAACIVRTFAADQSQQRDTSSKQELGFMPGQRVHSHPCQREESLS